MRDIVARGRRTVIEATDCLSVALIAPVRHADGPRLRLPVLKRQRTTVAHQVYTILRWKVIPCIHLLRFGIIVVHHGPRCPVHQVLRLRAGHRLIDLLAVIGHRNILQMPHITIHHKHQKHQRDQHHQNIVHRRQATAVTKPRAEMFFLH